MEVLTGKSYMLNIENAERGMLRANGNLNTGHFIETQREALERMRRREVKEQVMNREMAQKLKNQEIDRRVRQDAER